MNPSVTGIVFLGLHALNPLKSPPLRSALVVQVLPWRSHLSIIWVSREIQAENEMRGLRIPSASSDSEKERKFLPLSCKFNSPSILFSLCFCFLCSLFWAKNIMERYSCGTSVLLNYSSFLAGEKCLFILNHVTFFWENSLCLSFAWQVLFFKCLVTRNWLITCVFQWNRSITNDRNWLPISVWYKCIKLRLFPWHLSHILKLYWNLSKQRKESFSGLSSALFQVGRWLRWQKTRELKGYFIQVYC